MTGHAGHRGRARRGRGAAPVPGLARKVAALVAPWWRALAVVAACIVVSALAGLVPAFVVRHVVNADLVARRTAGLLPAAAIYLGAVATGAAFTFAYAYLAARVSQSAVAALRARLFAHVTAFPVAFFDRTPVGDVISRATADVETIDELFTDGVATLVGQLVPLLATAAAMLALSPLLSAVAAIVLPPLVVVTRFLQVRVRDAQRANRVAVGRLNAELAEVVGGAETIRAFGRQGAFVDRFRQALVETLRAQRSSFGYNAFFSPVSGLLSSAVIALLLWAGAGHTFAGAGVNLGTLTAFILLFQSFFAPIVALGDEWQSVQAAIAGAERVFELLDLPVEGSAVEGSAVEGSAVEGSAVEGSTVEGSAVEGLAVEGSSGGVRPAPWAEPGIELRAAGFAYVPGRPVLADVSLTVGRGEHVAVVGRTGAGKSTLVALVGGLYAPTSGVVRLAGRDPYTLGDAERRRLVGVVPQTLQLFGGTIRDNLRLFDPAVPDGALWEALAIVGMADPIGRMPESLDTVLAGRGGGHGAVLSAGERQLLALARAIVLQPAVLLLDEATAVVDAASDTALRAALRRTVLRRGCSVLTVAHRIATAAEADRVAVVDDGRLVESGDPARLLATGGRFAAFAELEAAGWAWQEPTVDRGRPPASR